MLREKMPSLTVNVSVELQATKTAEEVRRILLGEPPRNPVNVIPER